MLGKIARSPPRPPFGLAEVPVTVGTSRLSCGKAVKREYSRQFGSHPGNPGLSIVSTKSVGILISCPIISAAASGLADVHSAA